VGANGHFSGKTGTSILRPIGVNFSVPDDVPADLFKTDPVGLFLQQGVPTPTRASDRCCAEVT
jgi:hypothetical protein